MSLQTSEVLQQNMLYWYFGADFLLQLCFCPWRGKKDPNSSCYAVKYFLDAFLCGAKYHPPPPISPPVSSPCFLKLLSPWKGWISYPLSKHSVDTWEGAHLCIWSEWIYIVFIGGGSKELSRFQQLDRFRQPQPSILSLATAPSASFCVLATKSLFNTLKLQQGTTIHHRLEPYAPPGFDCRFLCSTPTPDRPHYLVNPRPTQRILSEERPLLIDSHLTRKGSCLVCDSGVHLLWKLTTEWDLLIPGCSTSPWYL